MPHVLRFLQGDLTHKPVILNLAVTCHENAALQVHLQGPERRPPKGPFLEPDLFSPKCHRTQLLLES